MRNGNWLGTVASLVFPFACIVTVGCSSGSLGNGDGDGGIKDAPYSQPEAVVISMPEVGGGEAGNCSKKITPCFTATGQYCGNIGDNCNGTLACGPCPAGQSCVGHVCV